MGRRGDQVNRPIRIIILLFLSFILFAITGKLALYITNLRTRHRAESLLIAVEHLRLGQSTFTDTQPLRFEYNAGKNPDAHIGAVAEQSYSINVSSDILKTLGLKYPGFMRFGVRPSAIQVNLHYRAEKLSYVSYTFYSAALSASGRPRILSAEIRLQELDNSPFQIFAGRRNMWTFGEQGENDQVLAVALTPKATIEEHKVAFGFDLSCMSTLRGCEALCEMMPSVWREALRRNANKQLLLPQELLQDPRCFPR
jgi:hypothetical protein